MATIQKIRTRSISILCGICAAFIAFIFGISFLMALAFLIPIVLFSYTVMFGIILTNRLHILTLLQLQPIFHKGRTIYKKLAAGTRSFKYLIPERESLIE